MGRQGISHLLALVALSCIGLFLSRCGSNTEVIREEDSGAQGTGSLLWSVSDLDAQMASNPDLVILDCRTKEARSDGSLFIPYEDEHITGSYFLDFFVFGDPYPHDLDRIVQALSELGITVDTPICLYDAGIANPQGKVFFNLERLGCKDVHILNGGFPVWKSAGGAVSSEPTPLPEPSGFVPEIDNSCYAELADMKGIFDMVYYGGSEVFTLTDYREPPLYWGHQICPDAVRHGRMPACGLLDWHDFYDSSTGLFLPAAEIEGRSIAAGQDPNKVNVLICNKGWRTGIAYFALRTIGWPKSSIIHYVGGVREWTLQDPLEYPMVSEGCYHVGKNLPPGNNSAKRFSGAFAQVGSEVYCIGGYLVTPKPGTLSDRVQAYDIASDSWRDGLAVLPEPLAFAAGAAVTSDFIYVMGGLGAGGISSKVFRYDPAGDVWDDGTVEEPLPEACFSFIAASVGDTIYVCGGLTGTDGNVPSNYSSKVFAYDTQTREWDLNLPGLPHGRRCHAMAVLGNTLYVLGGFYKEESGGSIVGVDLRDVWALDVTNPTAWEQKADLPFDVAGHGAAVANGKIYVLGGWSLDGIKYDVAEYDAVADSARILYKNGRSAGIGWPRYWYFTGAYGDFIASIGGYGGGPGNIQTTPNGGKTHFYQTYVYDLTNAFDE